ncbi:hypothetical protein L6R50_27000 [Myxococcota bacterium]|nr:hypothetical protein [Myxococcota bacterium]
MTAPHPTGPRHVVPIGLASLLLLAPAWGCGPAGSDDDATPSDDDSTPDDDTTAKDDDTSPPDDDSSPPDDDTAPPDDDSSKPDDDTTPADADGDGFLPPEDCDDADPARYPGASEVVCDGIDQDCDASDATEVRHADADGDGYGAPDTPLECGPAPDYVSDSLDCDDADPNRHPGAPDPCNGIDEDCDGSDFCSIEGTLDVRLADVVIYTSDTTYACSGCPYVARAGGDINGDGFSDVIVGQALGWGTVWVLYGPLSGWVDLAGADAQFQGEHDFDLAGVVAAAGDVNDDGYDDFVVGGPAYPGIEPDIAGYDGVVYVVYGPVSGEHSFADADGVIYGEAGSHFGHAVSGAGDVNGDGYADVVVGAPSMGVDSRGAAFVFYGPLDGSLSAVDAEVTLVSDVTYQHVGYSVAGGHDTDADGIPDLLIGTDDPEAYLVTGPPAGTWALADAEARFTCTICLSYGFRLAFAGDVDGNGSSDLLVGDLGLFHDGVMPGGAFLFGTPISGDVHHSSATTFFIGEADGDYAGASVSGAGDVDGDGADDLLIGAWFNDTGTTDSGAAYLFYGPVPAGEVSLSLADARIVAHSPMSAVGYDVASVGDINGDGLMDFAILAGAEVGGLEQTPAYVFYGRPR